MKNERREFEGYLFTRKEIEPIPNLVVALEGPVCAGKTTVLERLKADGISIIQEYSEYVDSATRDFPNFPPKDEESAKGSFKFFFDLELKRHSDLNRQNGKFTVIDRSVYTLLAFEVGASRLTGIDILPWAIEYLEEHKNEIIIPEHVVYMDNSVEESRRRAEEGKIRIAEFLLTDEFNKGFRSFFLALKEKAPNLIDIVDASREPEDVRFSVSSLITGKDTI